MSRQRATVYIDGELLQAAEAEAIRQGKRRSEIFEAALRSYIDLSVVQRAWERGSLSEDEALRLAYDELHASRR